MTYDGLKAHNLFQPQTPLPLSSQALTSYPLCLPYSHRPRSVFIATHRELHGAASMRMHLCHPSNLLQGWLTYLVCRLGIPMYLLGRKHRASESLSTVTKDPFLLQYRAYVKVRDGLYGTIFYLIP